MNITEEEIIIINQRAMQGVESNELFAAEDLLSQLLHKLPESASLTLAHVMTLNNSAFVYGKLGNPLKAMSLLLRAYQFKPSQPSEFSYLLGTLVNLSCVNCSTGNFKIALKQAFKAVEMTEAQEFEGLRPAAYYNLSCVLAKMHKFEKAGFYFGESLSVCRGLLGAKHGLSVASSKRAEVCQRMYGNRSKHSSFTSHTAKLTKYVMKVPDIEQKLMEGKMKFNFSTKVSSISNTRKNVFNKILPGVGIPYLKELRYSKLNHYNFYAPKKFDSSPVSTTRTTKYNNITYTKKKTLSDHIHQITTALSALESNLQDFLESTRSTYLTAGFIPELSDNLLTSTIKIQKWFKFLKSKNPSCT